MSLTRMSAVISLVFWLLCAIGFFVVMFSGGGIETYAQDSTRHFEGAVVMCIGLLVAPAAEIAAQRGIDHLRALKL